jgi:LacI family transcriptional regulator
MTRKLTPPDGGRSTLRDVADRAGVSPATVSRVLMGNYPVASATKAKVLRAVRDLDYVVNAQARALSAKSTKMVAFLVDDVTGAFYAHISRGVERQAKAEGRMCMLCVTEGDPEQVYQLIELMREQGADAVVMVGGEWEDEEYRQRLIHYARALDRSGSRLVLVGRPPLGDDVPSTVVDYDNEGGSYAITSHLLSSGHRRIAYVGAVPGLVTSGQRLDGYRRAHEAHGVDPDPALVIPGSYHRSSGYEGVQRLTESKKDFTAVMAATDVVAAGVLAALRDAGLRVPEDVAVTGYDDIPLAADLNPPLTTVRVAHEELGRTAIRLALNRDRYPGEQHQILGTHVVVRESAPSPARRR